MAAGDTTVRNQGILVERVGREQCSHLSLRTGLGLEECIPAAFTAMALALTNSQQNEASSSAGASAGDSSSCSLQFLLPPISAPISFCSHQFLLPAASASSSFCSQQWGWRKLWDLTQVCENSLQTSDVCPGWVSDPFMNDLGKSTRIVLIACCRGVRKVLAFPLEGL